MEGSLGEPVKRLRSPAGFPLPFSTYVPADMVAEPATSAEGEAVRFTARFAGRREDDIFLLLVVPPAATDAAAAARAVRRMAESYGRAWSRLYPDPRGGSIPEAVLATWPRAVALVVDAICYQPFPSLGGKKLAEVIRFQPKEQTMIEEAAQRLAKGIDPGIVPERFLIGAARFALDHRLARPGVITRNFYCELARR